MNRLPGHLRTVRNRLRPLLRLVEISASPGISSLSSTDNVLVRFSPFPKDLQGKNPGLCGAESHSPGLMSHKKEERYYLSGGLLTVSFGRIVAAETMSHLI